MIRLLHIGFTEENENLKEKLLLEQGNLAYLIFLDAGCFANLVSPEDIIPVPKKTEFAAKSKRKSRAMTNTILTSSPFKTTLEKAIEERAKPKSKAKRKLALLENLKLEEQLVDNPQPLLKLKKKKCARTENNQNDQISFMSLHEPYYFPADKIFGMENVSGEQVCRYNKLIMDRVL